MGRAGQMMLRLVCVWMVVAVCCASDTSVPESEPATDQGTQFLAEVEAETTRAATVQPALDVMPIDTEEQAEDVSDDTSDEQEWQKMPRTMKTIGLGLRKNLRMQSRLPRTRQNGLLLKRKLHALLPMRRQIMRRRLRRQQRMRERLRRRRKLGRRQQLRRM